MLRRRRFKAPLIDAAAPLIVAQRQSALAKPDVRDNDPRIPAPIFSSRLTPSSHPDRRATVYIEFSPGIGQGEMPPLFVIGQDGKPELVNYRIYRNVLIADRLFAAAELRLGADKQQKVRIVRSDGRRS
ncbi:TrbG/VirB9 family P-type conjugative transfer protein [Bradyrhizobium sp. USDA 4369]